MHEMEAIQSHRVLKSYIYKIRGRDAIHKVHMIGALFKKYNDKRLNRASDIIYYETKMCL